jgi:hypothetical protein
MGGNHVMGFNSSMTAEGAGITRPVVVSERLMV